MNNDHANAHPSTRPTSESGKERSSRNASKHGLFAAHDFVRETETDEYAQTFAALMAQLTPEGFLEEVFAAEIMAATWRLRRCRILEKDCPDFSNEQKSVDRARAQSHAILRRSMAELRKLQTERTIHARLETSDVPALTCTKEVFTTLALDAKQRLASRKADGVDSLEGLLAQADRNLGMQSSDSSFCKTSADVPGVPKTAVPPVVKMAA